MKNTTVHRFQQDLPVSDNPALTLAIRYGRTLSIYIVDDDNADWCVMGAANRWWR